MVITNTQVLKDPVKAERKPVSKIPLAKPLETKVTGVKAVKIPAAEKATAMPAVKSELGKPRSSVAPKPAPQNRNTCTCVPMFERLFTEALKYSQPGTSLQKIRTNIQVSPKICARTSAYFICENDGCKNKRWVSNRAWITIDLARPGVLRRYRQRCAGCAMPSWPRVFSESLVDFAEFIIEIYINRLNGFRLSPVGNARLNGGGRGDGGPQTNKNHRQDLCEKCGYGKRNCGDGISHRFP